MSFKRRLEAVIPGGAHTYSRGADQFPANAPEILERGRGAYLWDPSGTRYLDYGMALRSVTIGYADPRVNAAAVEQIERGNNLTRASIIELTAAERLVDVIPSAEMVKFAKNGSNVTTAAIKLARAYTGRRYVCIPRQHPFFSFDDWFIGRTVMSRGVPEPHAASTLLFDYGDSNSLVRLFDAHPAQIAAVMMEPATTQTPCAAACTHRLTYDSPCRVCVTEGRSFIHQVQGLCRQHGALFVLDEMISGFRWRLDGAQGYFGVQPDLTTFGKGMANGFSVAALAGRREVMEVGAINRPGAERVFLLSTTHGAEMSGLGAFVATLNIYRETDVCRHLWDYGRRLRDGLLEEAANAGVAAHFRLDGPDIHLAYVFVDAAGVPSLELRTLFAQEMVRHHVLMPWIAVSMSHGDDEFTLTMQAARAAFGVIRLALDSGVEKYLIGDAIKPVFRKFN
jgi:glutamate-1-semialdehyde 2,1-aminomutase